VWTGCLSFFLFVQDLVFDFSGPEIWPPVLGLCAAPLIRFLPVDLVFGLGASCLQILRERALCSVSCCVSSSCKSARLVRRCLVVFFCSRLLFGFLGATLNLAHGLVASEAFLSLRCGVLRSGPAIRRSRGSVFFCGLFGSVFSPTLGISGHRPRLSCSVKFFVSSVCRSEFAVLACCRGIQRRCHPEQCFFVSPRQIPGVHVFLRVLGLWILASPVVFFMVIAGPVDAACSPALSSSVARSVPVTGLRLCNIISIHCRLYCPIL
jgi:hypothetical protein